MLLAFIDDSGTDPNQAIAIAAALVIPATRIELLDEIWRGFLRDELIPEFHTSECVAGQRRTPFEGWMLQRKKRTCFKVREITKQSFVRAFSIAINKADYDEYVTKELRQTGGQYHYTWAIRHLISQLDEYATQIGLQAPYEYIFDRMGRTKGNQAKKEIETVMGQAESLRPGFYEGHYAFKNRKEYPGLQCVDLAAWTNYQFACFAFNRSRLHSIADNTFWEYERFQNRTWMTAITQKREQLKDWADREIADPRSQERRRQWLASRKAE